MFWRVGLVELVCKRVNGFIKKTRRIAARLNQASARVAPRVFSSYADIVKGLRSSQVITPPKISGECRGVPEDVPI